MTNEEEKRLKDEYWRNFGHWHIKVDLLSKEIEKLKTQKNTISLISAFLLETQYIEFHLQGLVIELDFIGSMEPKLTRFHGRKSSKEVYEMSLGNLKDEVSKYKAKFVLELVVKLEKLNKLRIQFAHHLFTYATSIDDLEDNAKKGLELNNKVLEALNNSFNFLRENSKFEKELAARSKAR